MEKVKWSSNEEKVVITKVGANPYNLQKAFREASTEINRTPSSISYKWYRGGLREKYDKLFIIYGKQGTLNSNRKNILSSNSNNTIRTEKSKWIRILNILFGNRE